MIIVIPLVNNNLVPFSGNLTTAPDANLLGGNRPKPIVIVDYTRSDEQYTLAEMKSYALQFASNLITNGKIAGLSDPVVYSLDYSMSFTHTGVNFDKEALKTKFNATIKNAPSDLVALLKIRQVVSAQNLELLSQALSQVVDPQIIFPTGGFVVRTPDKKIVTRQFTIYSTPYKADQRRVNTTLNLIGGGYEDAVMRLKLSFNLNKELTLSEQLTPKLSALGYTVNYAKKTNSVDGASLPDVELLKPITSKYYSPAPLENLLSQICQDNNLISRISANSILFLKPAPDSPPPSDIKVSLSFVNSIPNTKLISNFLSTNYAGGEFECELFDVTLYDSVAVYDDSGQPGLFANLTRITNLAYRNFIPYRFYVQAYTITDSRFTTSLSMTATNNWLLSVVKVDAIFENKIYANAAENAALIASINI